MFHPPPPGFEPSTLQSRFFHSLSFHAALGPFWVSQQSLNSGGPRNDYFSHCSSHQQSNLQRSPVLSLIFLGQNWLSFAKPLECLSYFWSKLYFYKLRVIALCFGHYDASIGVICIENLIWRLQHFAIDLMVDRTVYQRKNKTHLLIVAESKSRNRAITNFQQYHRSTSSHSPAPKFQKPWRLQLELQNTNLNDSKILCYGLQENNTS